MRDATDYYNLLSDTFKNGSSQIKYLYNKIEKAKSEGKYINIRTGYLIQEKDYFNKDYFFNYDQDFPLCYNFSRCGLARKKVIQKMMNFYLSCLREFDVSHDEELMKEKIKNELELAKNDYEYLNKNNNGYDDLKLFNTAPQKEDKTESEPSINTSSFINDESSEEEDNNSFIDDKSLSEKKEEKKKKCKLIKNGKKVINKYKEELNDLLEENYEGEDELYQEENEYSDNNEENDEISDEEKYLNIQPKFKKGEELHKTKLLTKKTKRNIIMDSDEEENDINDQGNKKEKIDDEDIKDLLEKYENIEDNNKKENLADKEYMNQLKENINLKQKTLDDFLKL